MGDPIRHEDLRGKEYPYRVEPREGLESDVQDDALAVAEFLDLEDDVQGRDGDDEGCDGEVHAPEAQRDNADAQGESEADDRPQRDSGHGMQVEGPDPEGEGVRSEGHEHDVAETHVSGQTRDQVEGV